MFEKILKAFGGNRKILEAIKKVQEVAQKDLVFFLNAMKMLFSFYRSGDEIMRMDDKTLKEDLASKLSDTFVYIFPFIPKNLLQSTLFLT